MILFSAWGLLGLVAIPAILAIHLFRRRFRPHAVTGLFLYGAPRHTVAAGRLRQRILWRASLWLELLAALAFTWYFTDPHWSDRERARHLVVVLDSRLRVAARAPSGVGVDETLRREFDRRFAALGRDDRVTLIASGEPPRLLVGPSARPERARTVLATWRPDRPWHELDDALTLARSVAGDGALLILASDRVSERLPANLGIIARGQRLPTSGLADARWLNDSEGERIVVRVLAQGGACARSLALRDASGKTLASEALSLRDHEPVTVIMHPPAGSESELTLSLDGQDPLPDDDHARLLRPSRSALDVRVQLPPPLAAPVERACAALSDLHLDPLGANADHLLITTSAQVPAHGTWLLSIVPGTAKPALGPFLARRGHPLLGDLDFTGVLWSGGSAERALPRAATALLEAGESVLISETRRERDRLITLHLDLTTSNLAHHPAWPSLFANLIAARRAALPGVRAANVLIGQPSTAVLPTGSDAVTLMMPDGANARLLADGDGEVLIPALSQPGIHRLVLDGQAAERAWARFNVLALDPRLGDLAEAGSSTREPTESRSAVERSRSTLEHLLPLVLAAAAALAGWWIFRREEGVAP